MIYLSTHVKGILKHRAGVEKKLIVLWSFPCYAMGWLVTVVYFLDIRTRYILKWWNQSSQAYIILIAALS